MIRTLRITNRDRMPCAWWAGIEGFAAIDRFEFEPGVNILWGPNGCGKSSVLRVLARMTHCEQSGSPVVTNESLKAMRDGDGAEIDTDGKPVHFFDPTMRAGLFGGMAGFDYDFLGLAFQTMARDRLSSGQGSTAEFNRIAAAAANTKEVQWRVPHKISKATRGLVPTPSIEEGLPVLLLDEPERSLSLPKAADLWHVLAKQKRFQVIVATHSISALGLEGAKYFDLVPGYLAECMAEVRLVAHRLRRV